MSLSETYFQKRRRRFWRKVIFSAAAIALIGITLSVFISLSKAIVVEVTPHEAAATARRELSGFGFIISDKVYLVGRQATLAVSADGFVSRTVKLDRDTDRHNVTVALKESQALVKATAHPGEADIQWRIDEQLVGEGAVLAADLEAGAHTLAVSHPYYETQVVALDLKRGAEQAVALTLEPVQGEIKVSSEPQGVEVMLDGKPVGKTPVNLAREGGGYRLEIKEDNFIPLSDWVEVTAANPSVARDYRLSHKQAHVELSLSPPGGQLLVNGKLVPAASSLKVEPLRETVITYSKAGYFSRTIRKTFKPAQSAKTAFSLSPEFGEVTIDTVPGSTITLDGEAAGPTPRTFKLRAVAHTATLSKKGYRAVTVTFKPTSKHVTNINRTLKTELEVRLVESPRQKTNSAGVELILFDPRPARMPFTIGAPRGERGQRANEFLRTVRLGRPFYASRKEISAAQYNGFRSEVPASALPVTNITWDEAAAFCNWMSAREKLAPFYTTINGRVAGFKSAATGYRLLSEAEWEWLARYAGRAESARFVWGNQTVVPKKSANIADESAKGKVEFYVPNYNDGHAQAAPVGSLNPDAAGLYDMAGNVSEWVNDVYTLDQPRGSLADPLGPQTGAEHVVKGSNWRSGTLSSLRSSFRQGLSGKRDDVGFRVGRYIYVGSPE